MREKLNRGDWIFLAVCGAIFSAGLATGLALFDDAFPEASIDFRYDRRSSARLAENLLRDERILVDGYRHAAEFGHDDLAKIFLEREIGLEKSNELTRGEVKIWYWRHRWFKPLQIEEVRVDVAPTGEIVAFHHRLPEERPAPALARDEEQQVASAFLRRAGIRVEKLTLVSRSEQTLPKRKDVTYVWEAPHIRPEGGRYRYSVVLQGDRVGAFSQFLKVPDQWGRGYEQMRSKNLAAAAVNEVFMTLIVVAALATFIARLRRGDIQMRFALGAGTVGALLVIAVALNEFPSALAGYDTGTSYPAFLAQQILYPVVQGFVAGIFLAVVVGAGESLYRQRLPGQLAMPRAFTSGALTSKRVFKGFILGYTLFAAFLAYQVLFYLGASHLGAWAPAEIPYASILNSAFPWAAVLFMGFFPAMSEEFMSRAFSIPFFERWVRSRFAAMLIAGFIWGFGHAAYPNQPFYIRGVEVGIVGVVMGLLMYRFGILGLLVWHYTVDALYTALLLFRSNNAYYIFSAGLASLIFVIPTIAAVILYRRNGGFLPDANLSNSAIGSIAPPQPAEETPLTEPVIAEARPVSKRAWVTLAIALPLAILAVVLSGPSLEDIVDYRLTRQQATAIARRHLAGMRLGQLPSRVVRFAAPGFRSWNPSPGREEGGGPQGYDDAALLYLMRHPEGSLARVLDIQRNKVEAATWVTRFFSAGQKEEIFVEVDPRNSGVVGMHRYREEEAPGPLLDQAAAESMARRELPRYGLNPDGFELKEALSFQQPNRRDWLFHFEERRPLLGEAVRRASVRVTGDQVSQFARTIRIPERERREAEKETVLNTILAVGRIVALVVLIGLVVFGCVSAARLNRFAWRTATRWSLILLPLPIAVTALQRESLLQRYQTSMPWETFMIAAGVGALFLVAFQAGIVWLSVAIAETVFPAARRVMGRYGAAVYGRAAVVAALTAASLFVLLGVVLRSLPGWFPRSAPLESLAIPDLVALPVPSLAVLWQAILAALALSAAVAGIAAAIDSTPENRRWVIHALLFGSLVLIGIDSSMRPREMPLTILSAVAAVAMLTLVIRFVLRDNLLAYPLTFFSIALVSGIAALLQNHRADLRIHAAALVAAGITVMTVLLRPRAAGSQ